MNSRKDRCMRSISRSLRTSVICTALAALPTARSAWRASLSIDSISSRRMRSPSRLSAQESRSRSTAWRSHAISEAACARTCSSSFLRLARSDSSSFSSVRILSFESFRLVRALCDTRLRSACDASVNLRSCAFSCPTSNSCASSISVHRRCDSSCLAKASRFTRLSSAFMSSTCRTALCTCCRMAMTVSPPCTASFRKLLSASSLTSPS
mmetsp:Transcript_12113/g.17516  ORF Transcript_12113/g.17516 Transcript_12113/m.17516 type:complete len:210 (-) Transcript_12113:736-1365(-)